MVRIVARQQFRRPQGSVEPLLRSGFYIEPFGLLNHIETS